MVRVSVREDNPLALVIVWFARLYVKITHELELLYDLCVCT